MQIVSKISLDASLGNCIQLSVFKIHILKEEESFVPKNGNQKISTSDILKACCKRQAQLNPYFKSGPELFDVALLL